MKIGILGGGFGLYGYLPALLKIPGSIVLLPSRYQERLKARVDIGRFYNLIEWVDNDEALLETCEGVVISLTPAQQYIWAKKCLNLKNIHYLLLEKPLAPSPALSDDLLSALQSSGKNFRLGYNFRFTHWAETLIKNPENIQSISWDFRAHHYAQNIPTWKRWHEDGGGALRFYGIHLIALLAEVGYNDVSYSKIVTTQKGEAENWEAELGCYDLPSCKVYVASNSNDISFTVKYRDGRIDSLLQPFQTAKQSEDMSGDQRVPFLKEGLLDLFGNKQAYYEWYRNTNLLWNKIEEKTLIS